MVIYLFNGRCDFHDTYSMRQGSVPVVFSAVPPEPRTMLAYGRVSINTCCLSEYPINCDQSIPLGRFIAMIWPLLKKFFYFEQGKLVRRLSAITQEKDNDGFNSKR